jgi:AcrR family transcriptional regulator
MARPIPEGRFSQLIEVATKTYVARGYRLTQMPDVADALGVAKVTLYGYVESKEALFDAAVRFADNPSSDPGKLPIPTLAAGARFSTSRRGCWTKLVSSSWSTRCHDRRAREQR